MKCPNCGAPRSHDDRCCPYCRTKFAPSPDVPQEKQEIHIHYHQEAPKHEPQVRVEHVYVDRGPKRSPRSRLAALLLCFFLGTFGAHKFYLGKIGMGLVYLFTYGLFGLGWLIDLIILLCGKPRDKQGLRLTWR